ncbi:hypothetical protein [Mycolicibacterium goodii]|uniref:Intersectin-EH binding protein Ibp1 n=1 Tax=Mycolicibacterium goodii TaxID=134601 RepID=A0A0K0XG91_MYCGD|nr:intersectin-EH binding protein Ibp1 [Mycolicibacterium goodii]
MPTFPISIRRRVFAGGFVAAAVAAPAISVVTVLPGSAIACSSGEEADQFTGVCVPHTVPNSPSSFGSIPGNPNLPTVNEPGGGGSIPCTGANTGECIGLAEEAQSQGPQVQPRSTVGISPTVTGYIG